MPILNFAKWSRAARRWFTYRRLYWKGYIWTPIVIMARRYA